MKQVFRIMALCSVIAFFALPLAMAVPHHAPAGSLAVKIPKGHTPSKPVVHFSHDKHTKIQCTSCHHTWNGKSQLQSCSSKGCHDRFDSKQGKRSFHKAFHSSKTISCLGCHKSLKKKKAAKYGPRSCKDCHKK